MADQDAPESQRRQATVMFADISGFTAMSEKLDPEEVTEIMNDCFAMVERVILDHGGQVDKYIGDAVMALFGAQQVVENAARHGVHASLEIRSGLEHFNRERALPVPLQVHIGLNTGLVVAGEVGGKVKRDFTVMGDTVNLAARLEDASEKGQIFVGPTTYAVTRDDFDYRPTKRLELKGKSEPVQAYEVVGIREKAEMPRLGAATRRISSEIVGRQAEIDLLRGRIGELLDGQGGYVSLVGDAGIGKSRLLAELSSDPRLAGVTVLVGRADSVGSGLSYHPFADLVRDFAGILPGDGDRERYAKLERAIMALPADRHDDILPYVARLMGYRREGESDASMTSIDADAIEKLVAKAMRDLFVLIAGQKPLLLCFEDLHWADQSSIRLIELLLRLGESEPLLFVFTMRPHADETSERIFDLLRRRHAGRHVEVHLHALDPSQSHALVRNLLGIENLPQRTRDLIAQRAEGNPFFIEEIVRGLIDEGAIEVRDGRLAVTEKLESVTIPGTLQEVILTRVQRLQPAARRVLELGAVLGRSHSHRLLVELSGGAEDELVPALAELKERQVLEEQEDRSTASVRRTMLVAEKKWVFGHALIHQTIYESMLLRRRRELHLRAAQAIERLYADGLNDYFGVLALHYGRAENLERAQEYLVKAGDEAVRSAASAEALQYFREAYRIFNLRHGEGGDPALRLTLEKSLATALMLTGRLSEARPHFDRALSALGERVVRNKKEAYRQLAKDAVRILLRVLRGRMSRREPPPEMREAVQLLYSRCRAECVADPEWFLFDAMYMVGRVSTVDPRPFDESFAQWAGVALLFSYSGISFRLSRRIIHMTAYLVRDDAPSDYFVYNLMTFMCDYFEGRWDRPSGVDDELIERTLRAGYFWDVDTFLGMDANKELDHGNWDAAHHRLDKIREIAFAYGYSFAETNVRFLNLYEALQRRDLDYVFPNVEAYLERPEEFLNLIGLGFRMKAEVLAGCVTDATETAVRAERLLSRIERVTPFHSGPYRVGKLLLDVTLLEQATTAPGAVKLTELRKTLLRDGKEAVKTAKALAMIRTEVLRLVGTGHLLSGSRRKALRWWTDSLREGERLRALPELARTHAEIARRLASEPATKVGGKTVEEHRARAVELFEQLGLLGEAAALRGEGTEAGAVAA